MWTEIVSLREHAAQQLLMLWLLEEVVRNEKSRGDIMSLEGIEDELSTLSVLAARKDQGDVWCISVTTGDGTLFVSTGEAIQG